MARVLILYGTSEGQTARIAGAIAKRLDANGIDSDVVQAGTLDPRPCDYAGVIVAGSIHAGGYRSAWRGGSARTSRSSATGRPRLCRCVWR